MKTFVRGTVLVVIVAVVGYVVYARVTKKLTVSGQTAVVSSLTETISAEGRLVTKEKAVVYAPFTGRVTKRHVDSEQLVLADDWLFTIKNLATNEEEIVRSPFEGVAFEITSPAQPDLVITDNAVLTYGQPVFIVERLDFDFVAMFNQTDLDKVEVGSEATFTLDAFPNQPIKGRVKQLGHATVTNMVGEVVVPVTVHILELLPEPRLIGLTGDVSIKLKEKSALTVPLDALTSSGDEDIVFIVQNGKAEQKEVVVGDIFEDRIEVKAGVGIGDFVITDPVEKVSAGVKVNVE